MANINKTRGVIGILTGGVTYLATIRRSEP